MAEGRMKGRVKGLLAGHPDADPRTDADLPPGPRIPPQMLPPDHAMASGPRGSSAGMADSDAERQALQVLMLARRTADEHVALANRQADAVRADARAAAEQIVREAQDAAERSRRDAERALSEAQTRANQIVHDAQAVADDLRNEAEQERADAHAAAGQTIDAAKAHAADLEREAEERYEEAIGGLAEERAALQQEIEALHQFDREYRTRLRVFMHNQLRALDEGEPATGDLPMAADAMPAGRLDHP